MVQFAALVHDSLKEVGESGDEETADLFTGVSRDVSKDAWFIGAHHTSAKS